MTHRQRWIVWQTRRAFLANAATGLGAVALGELLAGQSGGAAKTALAAGGGSASPAENKWRGVVHPLHHPAKAKRVIWLTMAGGASHLETFDWNPKLAEMHGKPIPESMTKGQQVAQLQGQQLVCYGPQWKFKRMGPLGVEICELFPQIAGVVGDNCVPFVEPFPVFRALCQVQVVEWPCSQYRSEFVERMLGGHLSAAESQCLGVLDGVLPSTTERQ